jgi:hypothetical protein
MTTAEYEQIANMARQLGLRERLQLLQELLGTISNDVVETGSKRSIFELKGVGAEMWRDIDVDEYIRQERASWDG